MILLFLICLPCLFSLDILMYVNVIGKSHLQFAEKLISLLNERGHTVDMILGMLNSNISLKKSYSARQMVSVHFPGNGPWGKVAHHLNDPFEERYDWNRLNTLRDTSHLLCELLINSREVDVLLSSVKYDLALISAYDFCPFALAHHYKIVPVVSYTPTPAFHYIQSYYAGLPDLPLYENIFDRGYSDMSSFISRVWNTLQKFNERWNHHNDYSRVNEILRARFGQSFPDVRDIAKNITLDFSNSHPLLEEPRPTSLRMRYFGGIGLPKPKPLSKEFDDMLNRSAKGTVLFSFGTQIGAEKISPKLRDIFVNTFKRFPKYNFLWKFDGKTQMNASNVFNLEWLPQTDLLYDNRVVAFISHLGVNSFTEASFAGVPVVSIPLFGDQINNARRVEALGTGIIVRKSQISPEALHWALTEVLLDGSYSRRAREIAAMIAASPDTPQRIFFEGIEFAAKFKNLAPHYRLAGADHHFFVQNSWDVAACFTLVLIIASFFAAKATRFASSARSNEHVQSKCE